MPLIELRNLETIFDTDIGPVAAVRGVDLKVDAGGRHALIGQSGAGKSILALSIMGLLPENARVTGSVRFQGREILGCPEETLRRIRGRQIRMVFQNPLATLNPVLNIGTQLCEIPMVHEGVSRNRAEEMAVGALSLCELPDPERILLAYPFELSGGMLQRVVIAMGIVCRPELLIADEPLKGLDVRLQRQVAATLHRVCRELGTTLLIITHNLKIAQSLCDSSSVMFEGRIVETASCADLFSSPGHVYSKRLLDAYHLFSGPLIHGEERRAMP